MDDKLRLYLDSSVLGATFDTESKERVSVTQGFLKWLSKRGHTACISGVTLEEIGKAPTRIRSGIEQTLRSLRLEILAETNDAKRLASAYLAARAVPQNSIADARHIAVASVHNVDALVSWNFQHMVNLFRRRKVHAVNLTHGKPLIDIVSPIELLEAEEDENG